MVETYYAWVRPSGTRKWVRVYTGTERECHQAASNHAVVNKWKDADIWITKTAEDPNVRKKVVKR